MLTKTEAQLFLSDQRGCSQLDWFRSLHTFNFGAYQAPGRAPFGNVYVVNDDTLAAGRGLSMQVEEPTHVLVLPLVGGVEVTSTCSETAFLGAGESLILSAPTSTVFSITNPYETELVNFIQIWLKADPGHSFQPGLSSNTFDLSTRNQLLPIGQPGVTAFIGQYTGRAEGVLPINDPKKGVFAFVIEGAFEVQNRLLQARDGLALWHVDEVEFEALSNDALILFVAVN